MNTYHYTLFLKYDDKTTTDTASYSFSNKNDINNLTPTIIQNFITKHTKAIFPSDLNFQPIYDNDTPTFSPSIESTLKTLYHTTVSIVKTISITEYDYFDTSYDLCEAIYNKLELKGHISKNIYLVLADAAQDEVDLVIDQNGNVTAYGKTLAKLAGYEIIHDTTNGNNIYRLIEIGDM